MTATSEPLSPPRKVTVLPAVLLAAALLPSPGTCAAPETGAACPGVIFTGTPIAWTAAERRLVCGDPDSESWQEVTGAQARRSLETFLQQRGYHHPLFKTQEGRLVVDPGRPTTITRLTGLGFPPGLDLSKRRRIVGAPLTPEILDKVKAGLIGELQNRGYPCPDVDISADPDTGEMRARFPGGVPHAADPIEEPAIPGVDPGIFRRFEAFARDRPLDQRLLTLTSDRVVSEALFLNSSYDVTCGTGGVRIIHRASSAPPRLFRIGAGIDTEGLVRLRVNWTHSRIGWRASTAQATLSASRREQSLAAQMRWYLSPSSRLHLLPRAAAARSDEPRFETVSSAISLEPAFTSDDQTFRYEYRAGPALEYADTRRGIGPRDSTFPTFNTHVEMTSHLFEYHRREPRGGFHADFDTASRFSRLNSSLTAHRLRLRTEKLWNVGAFEPPLAVLGARGWAGTTLVGDRDAALRELPPAMRFFIGGDADFRGVGPGELGDEGGFLSGVYLGLELRAADLLPYRVQPLIFLDTAMAGRSSLSLDPDVYYAPGFGARWSTFVGAFRITLARSMLWRRDPATAPGRRHWQFFFSYGREF